MSRFDSLVIGEGVGTNPVVTPLLILSGNLFPMRKIMFHGCTLAATMACAVLPVAQAASWHGSYVADEQCYCSGSQGQQIDSTLVPTPIGGQTVAQICARIGAGPDLKKLNGKFNYTVYPDAQCGNGLPGREAKADNSCAGHRGVAGEDCEGAGAGWNLSTVYNDAWQPRTVAGTSDDSKADTGTLKPGITDTPVVTNGSRYIKPLRKSDSAPAKETVTEAITTANPTATESVKPKPAKKKLVAKKPVAKEPTQQPVEPLTKEQIRARQLVQLEAARKRAESNGPSSAVEVIEIVETKPIAPDSDSSETIASLPSVNKADSNETVLNSEQTDIAKIDDAKPKLLPDTVEKDVGAVQSTVQSTKDQSIAKASDANANSKEKVEAASETIAAVPADDAKKTTQSSATASLSALRLPTAVRSSSIEFDYLEAAPVSFDFGGAGVNLRASKSAQQRFQFLLNASAADSYNEAALGVGWYFTPKNADRVTVLLSTGIETGEFEFSAPGVSTQLSDTGAYIGLMSRFVVNNYFELQAGVGYSSFFEGDATAFGAALLHVTKNLDITSRAEAGDNDVFGIGLRLYY